GRELILVAISEVEEERRAPRYRLCPEDLDTCISTLRGYLSALERGELPPRRQRPEGLGRMVLDSWPYDVPLANAVLKAERAWRNA
ncbi:MAG TPA: hypothetical protein VFG53_06695, partial [Anaeromyxobacter sp.]|nr:hypothetical protein [Anaeromyxobacter sp.]